jgi:hypothetical protein
VRDNDNNRNPERARMSNEVTPGGD